MGAVRPGRVLVGPETAPQKTESPGTQNPRKSEHPGCRVALQVGGGHAPSVQGVVRFLPASPCDRGPHGVCDWGVRPQGAGGQALRVPSRAPCTLAIRPLGWRLSPLDRDATALRVCELNR